MSELYRKDLKPWVSWKKHGALQHNHLLLERKLKHAHNTMRMALASSSPHTVLQSYLKDEK